MSKFNIKTKVSPSSGASAAGNSSMTMSNFKSSVNYLWNTNAVLGKGATGAVYFGHNKHSGETVAVKCFNHLSHMRPYEVQKREFEVLKKVNHENIVKLLAIEEENDTKQKVLVMELCTGGSLFNILDDPLNSNGLDEKEFLLVLKHLAAGMKHLRDMNIIHRDLKPGNIMKFVSEEGASIYKLTDFGAARELDDDQQFMSLYGTEEYLHPDMYERAVLRKPVGKSFKANVDLWSIGVTLYHIATGSLPFRPFGGRKNKETMYKITTEKSSGIISGSQTSENGEIKWSRTLPDTCLLSASVQPLVTELLAGLLECDAHRMWSFEKFFSSVTSALEHRVVFVFYVGTLTLYSIYCKPTDTVGALKVKFESIFQVKPKDQILLLNNDELNQMNSIAASINSVMERKPSSPSSEFSSTGHSLRSSKERRPPNVMSPDIVVLDDECMLTDLNTTENVPLFLLNGQINSKIRSTSGPIALAKFPEVANTVANTDLDAQYAKVCSSMAYTTLRSIDKFVHNYKLACSIPGQMLKLITRNIRTLDAKQSEILFHVNLFKERLAAVEEVGDNLMQLVKLMEVDSKIVTNRSLSLQLPNVEMIKMQYDQVFYNLKSLSAPSIIDDKLEQLKDLWPSIKEFDNTRRLILAQSKAKIFTSKIRECWLLLHKNKQMKTLNFHEDQLHQLEKMKLDNYCKKLNELVNKEINPCLAIADKLEEWYQGAQVAYVKPRLIIDELDECQPSIQEMDANLDMIKDEQNKVWQALFKQIDNFRAASAEANNKSVSSLNNNVTSLLDSLTLDETSTATPSTINQMDLYKQLRGLQELTKLLKDSHGCLFQMIDEIKTFDGQ